MGVGLSTIDKRLDALEDGMSDVRGYAKAIDLLRAAVRALEARVRACESAKR